MEVNYPKSGTRIKHILTLSDSPLKKIDQFLLILTYFKWLLRN